MSIERKCENCQFDSDGLNEICVDCLMCNKGASHIVFIPKEELIRKDERKQALFDIAMELEKDIPILENNYKYNNFGFQKGYWQGQLEYAYVLKNNLLDKANRKEL